MDNDVKQILEDSQPSGESSGSPAEETEKTVDTGEGSTGESPAPSDSETDASKDSSTKEDEPDPLLKAVTEAIDEEIDGEKKPEKEAKPEGEAKKEGEEGESKDDLHEMPEGLAPKSQQRFQALVNDNKEARKQVEEIQQKFTEITSHIEQAGINSHEFKYMMDYAKLVKTGDNDKARQILEAELRDLNLRTGHTEAPKIDPLQNFPHLREQVDNFDITEEQAMKIAQAEQITAQQGQRAEEQKAQAQASEAFEVARNKAISVVETMEEKWKATDIDYAAKSDKIASMLPKIAKEFPPEKWPIVVENYYNLLTEEARSGKGIDNQNKPLPSAGGTPPVKAPEEMDTMEEAIRQAVLNA